MTNRRGMAKSSAIASGVFVMPSRSPSDRKPSRRAKTNADAEPRLSRSRRPVDLAVPDWQTRLRRQYGREQAFLLENQGDEPIFSEFAVTNPVSKGRYRVVIRGAGLGVNYCSCPDFATNDLGTCKHIEFTLGCLEAKRGGKTALKRGFQPPYSELFLDYAGRRRVRFRAGGECPESLWQAAGELFDPPTGLPWRPRTTANSTPSSPPPAPKATNCAATTTPWPSSPKRAIPSGAERCWPRPIPRAPPVRP